MQRQMLKFIKKFPAIKDSQVYHHIIVKIISN